MRISILGSSHAPGIFREAARMKGVDVCELDDDPEFVLIAQDAPIAEDGERDLTEIRSIAVYASNIVDQPILLSSQVTPGFCRSLGIPGLYHMAETLRIKDALDRAMNPEQIIIGCENPQEPLPEPLLRWIALFGCPYWRMTYEEAEFSKIAINSFLAAQVDATNRLAKVAAQLGCDWKMIQKVLAHDRRIGRWAYLEPGRWQDSKHLLRDMVWLEAQ